MVCFESEIALRYGDNTTLRKECKRIRVYFQICFRLTTFAVYETFPDMKTFLPPPRCKMLSTLQPMEVNQKPIEVDKSDFFSLYRCSKKLGYKIVTRGWGKKKLQVWRVK